MANICQSINFPRGSEFTRASGGPQNYGKSLRWTNLNLEILTGQILISKFGKIWKIMEKFWRSSDFQGGSEFTRDGRT